MCVKNSVSAKDVEITNSKLAFSAVAKENKQLSNIKSELLSQIRNFLKVIDDQEKLINQKDEQIEDDIKDIDELKRKVVECEEDYKNKLKTFLKENDDLNSDLKTLSNHIIKKDKEVREMKAENEELINDKKKLEDQILTMETKKSTLKTELEEKNNIIAGNLHKIQRLEHKMNKNEICCKKKDKSTMI